MSKMIRMNAGSLGVGYQWSRRRLFNYKASSISLATLDLFPEKEYMKLFDEGCKLFRNRLQYF